MTFDPFGDFDTQGYLRNFAKEKDPAIVKRLEHTSFLTGIDAALAALSKRRELGYADVLQTHKTLFDAVYPWAGQDRTQTAPHLTIRKGPVVFANPADIRRRRTWSAARPEQSCHARQARRGHGLPCGHPFLDGNGRTIVTVHSAMAQHAGLSIDWPATDQVAYLSALTVELENPGKGLLDNYLRPFIGEAVAHDRLAARISAAPGVDGRVEAQTNEVVGDVAEPDVKAQYEAMLRKREQR